MHTRGRWHRMAPEGRPRAEEQYGRSSSTGRGSGSPLPVLGHGRNKTWGSTEEVQALKVTIRRVRPDFERYATGPKKP
jgi:hypothetical protein